MKYSDKTLQYYENMKNIGSLDENLPNVGTGIVGSPLCGDVMKLQLKFDENDIIVDAKYKVFGCVSAIASMELATTLLKGMTIEEAKKIKNEDVADSLELSDIKKHCSVLAKESIEAAINNYLAKKEDRSDFISISEPAVEKLKSLISEHENGCKGILISVLSGGCSGVDYSLSYVTETPENKKSVTVNDIVFFFEEEDDPMILGLQIDLIENQFGHGFVVTNKNHVPCQNCTCRCS